MILFSQASGNDVLSKLDNLKAYTVVSLEERAAQLFANLPADIQSEITFLRDNSWVGLKLVISDSVHWTIEVDGVLPVVGSLESIPLEGTKDHRIAIAELARVDLILKELKSHDKMLLSTTLLMMAVSEVTYGIDQALNLELGKHRRQLDNNRKKTINNEKINLFLLNQWLKKFPIESKFESRKLKIFVNTLNNKTDGFVTFQSIVDDEYIGKVFSPGRKFTTIKLTYRNLTTRLGKAKVALTSSGKT